MNDITILKKAIEKANKNEYNEPTRETCCVFPLYSRFIIFSHDFAKAFWGKEKSCKICGCKEDYGLPVWACKNLCISPDDIFGLPKYIEEWQYHLQQMVLEEEPIKYLEKFL